MEELVLVSSSLDAGIGCWNLESGTELMRYKSCSSTSHGVTCVSSKYVIASQVTQANASSGLITCWPWGKPQIDTKSFPEEPILPLIANSEGSYIIGGGSKGNIYFWEVTSGRLLKKWHAHHVAITCLVFSKDESLLVSGSRDGGVRVWSLFMLFGEYRSSQSSQLYEYSFAGSALPVTDLVMGHGAGSAIIISAFENRVCKVWSVLNGACVRSINFPCEITAISLDPGEHVFYAGGKDGKIYIVALNTDSTSNKDGWPFILGSLYSDSKGITCLAHSTNRNLLLAGSEDGMVRVWDPVSRNIVRILKYGKAPVNNITVVTRPVSDPEHSRVRSSSKRPRASLPSLEKYMNTSDTSSPPDPIVTLRGTFSDFFSQQGIRDHLNAFQLQRFPVESELEVERLKHDFSKSTQLLESWKKNFEKLQEFCINEILEEHS